MVKACHRTAPPVTDRTACLAEGRQDPAPATLRLPVEQQGDADQQKATSLQALLGWTWGGSGARPPHQKEDTRRKAGHLPLPGQAPCRPSQEQGPSAPAGSWHLGSSLGALEHAPQHGVEQLQLLVAQRALGQGPRLPTPGHQAGDLLDAHLHPPAGWLCLACLAWRRGRHSDSTRCLSLQLLVHSRGVPHGDYQGFACLFTGTCACGIWSWCHPRRLW